MMILQQTRGALSSGDQCSLDLPFAETKSLAARIGPTPNYTRASVATFVGGDGLIQTAATNTPRFDHDPVTLACKGLLIEESRTNLVANSNSFSNWTKSNATVAISSVSTPEGTDDAWKVVEDMLLASHSITRSFSAVSGTTYSASVWLKSAENGFALVGLTSAGGAFAGATFISVNLSTGAVTTAIGTPVRAASAAYSNGWFRVSFSLTAIGTFSALIDIRLSRDGLWANRVYLGNGVNGMYVYGAQVEAGSFASSYIPTTTTSAVRSADVCSISGSDFASFYNNTAGTLLTSAATVFTSTTQDNNVCAITGAITQFRIYNRSAQGGRLSAIVAGSAILTPATNYNTAGTFYKAALAADGAGGDYVINGTQIPDTFTGGELTADTLKITGVSATLPNLWISSIRYYKKRLPNAKLRALTA